MLIDKEVRKNKICLKKINTIKMLYEYREDYFNQRFFELDVIEIDNIIDIIEDLVKECKK